MPRVTYVSPDGGRRTVDAALGASVMQTAVSHDVDGIIGECGGQAMCATCHVYVEPEFLLLLPAQEEDEDEMLDAAASERLPNSRLSCQLPMTAELDGLVVQLPEEQL